MTTEELLGQLYDETLTGNKPAVLELTNQGLAQGLGPETLLYEALIPSLEEVGARFERGDFFVPEMLIAGKAMAGALEILRPLLAETGAQTIGKIVMGTVKGDVHDIGKNLVNVMFEGAGFEVIDLGVQVAPEKFVAAIQEHKPDIVGFSAFLTTTMPMFKANINALNKAGLRDPSQRVTKQPNARRGTSPCTPSCPRRPRRCGSVTTSRSRSSASGSTRPAGRSSSCSCARATCPGSRLTSRSRWPAGPCCST